MPNYRCTASVTFSLLARKGLPATQGEMYWKACYAKCLISGEISADQAIFIIQIAFLNLRPPIENAVWQNLLQNARSFPCQSSNIALASGD